MSPKPTRATLGGRAYNDLRNLAHKDGRDPAEYLTLYALEGFLSRLALSTYADDLILKGGVLMAAFAARRPTRDIDLAATGMGNDIAKIERRVRTIIESDIDDGLRFEPDSVAGEYIRDDADYAGIRVKVTARLATAKIPLHVDVNFGDPIWPAPAEAAVPRLLGGTVLVRGYPDHMVLAEKIVTALDRGEQNTRWRDFVDIAAITGTRVIQYADQRVAIETVAEYRQVLVTTLRPVLQAMPDLAQRKWVTWRRKQRLEDATPEQFGDLLTTCLQFSEPVLDGTAQGCSWEPHTRSWRPAVLAR